MCAIYIKSRICSWGEQCYLMRERFYGVRLILNPLDGGINVCNFNMLIGHFIHRSKEFFRKRWHIYVYLFCVGIFFVRILEVYNIWLFKLDFMAQI